MSELDGEEIQLRTVDHNPRFPNTNQTKHCWVHYVDYQRCLRHYKVVDNPEDPRCAVFKRNYESLCSSADVNNFDYQVESHTFPANLEPRKHHAHHAKH